MIKQVKSDIKRYLYSKASVVVLLFSLFFVVWHVATNIVKEVYANAVREWARGCLKWK